MLRAHIALLFAFLEGLTVLVVEIVGARALAPWFGSTHLVWTAQITATLLFLALGYGLGGRLSRRERPPLAHLFALAGLWLALFPWLRTPALRLGGALDLAGGSFLAAALLFGVPLLALGAVSPLLISHLDHARPGAGSAAGRIFFTSTLGGLVGGWLTALVLIPRVPLRLALGGAGVLLAALALAWAGRERRARSLGAAASLVAAALLAASPGPPRQLSARGAQAELLGNAQGQVGLVQVLDLPAIDARFLLVDGTLQGGVRRGDGRSMLGFSDYLEIAAHRVRPDARSALVIGLGPGVLARHLQQRGLAVTAVDIDAQVVAAARRFFGLPDAVTTHIADARVFLRQDRGRYDLAFLDVYAAESFPWHLATVEALIDLRARLTDHGVLVVNAITDLRGDSPGLERLEATLRAVFPVVTVHVEEGDAPLKNAVLLAGAELAVRTTAHPGPLLPHVAAGAERLFAAGRPARDDAPPARDDASDLDWIDAPLRLAWRASLLADLTPGMLAD